MKNLLFYLFTSLAAFTFTLTAHAEEAPAADAKEAATEKKPSLTFYYFDG